MNIGIRFKVQGNRLKAGFTLIEMMVVIGVLALLSLVTVNLLLTTLVGSTKDKTVQAVKLVGDTVLVQAENMIRSSNKLIENNEKEVCVPGSMVSLGLEDADGNQKIISESSGRLLLNSDYLTTGDLTATGLSFQCLRSGTGMPVYVDMEFTLTKGDPVNDKPEELYQETFKTGVSLRQF